MEKSEFSETQFVIGYTRELFNSLSYPLPFYYLFHAPSTKEEKKFASDLILRHYKGNHFRFSEFYQFKRSKFFNSEVFSDLKGITTIDTSTSPKYGFNIYNSKKTEQFNTLQKLALNRRNRVYYCAPSFHTITEFNRHFGSSTIQNNSKVFNFVQPVIQSAKIPLGSNHKVIFDSTTSYICSDPIEIESSFANDRFKQYENSESFNQSDYNFEAEVKELYNFVVEEINSLKLNDSFERPEINIFEVSDMLLSYFNIYWFPHFIQH